jgi:hypothetical protein
MTRSSLAFYAVAHGILCFAVGSLYGKSQVPADATATFSELELCRISKKSMTDHAIRMTDQRDEALGEITALRSVSQAQSSSIKNLDVALATERAKPPCDGGLK